MTFLAYGVFVVNIWVFVDGIFFSMMTFINIYLIFCSISGRFLIKNDPFIRKMPFFPFVDLFDLLHLSINIVDDLAFFKVSNFILNQIVLFVGSLIIILMLFAFQSLF